MNTAITQTIGQVFHISNTGSIVVFVVMFVFFNIFGLLVQGRWLGSFFGLIITAINLAIGFIPLWMASIGFAVCIIELMSYLIRGVPEKPAENSLQPATPPEITGSFDKSQFNKRR